MRRFLLAGVSLFAAAPRYRKSIGTLNRWRSSPDPLALSSKASTTPRALVGPAVELQVRLGLADHPVAAALREALCYHRPLVPYPQGDHAFARGPVLGDVRRVTDHVARRGMVDLHERTTGVLI